MSQKRTTNVLNVLDVAAMTWPRTTHAARIDTFSRVRAHARARKKFEGQQKKPNDFYARAGGSIYAQQ